MLWWGHRNLNPPIILRGLAMQESSPPLKTLDHRAWWFPPSSPMRDFSKRVKIDQNNKTNNPDPIISMFQVK